ncbi:MAG: response regulator transcription factor [Bacillaceae bacterium]
MNRKILIMEDERLLRDIIYDYFTAEGFEVLLAENGRIGLNLFQEEKVDLVILDIMMPELDGWSVCKRIRSSSNIPIIMLTARSEDDDKLLGFELGADEYVTKPFSPKVLVAQAKALLKRAEGTVGSEDDHVEIEFLKINRKSREVFVDNQAITLTHKEYELLLYLIDNKGIVLSREAILNTVWGYDYDGDDRTVDTHIKKLRNKLGEAAKFIATVIRVGYKFEV